MKEILLFIMKDLGKKLLFLLRGILIIAGFIFGGILVMKFTKFLNVFLFRGKGVVFSVIIVILLLFFLGIYIFHIVLAVKYYKKNNVPFDFAWHEVWDDSDEP